MNDMIKHHLTDQLLMGYSAGILPEAFNLAVATHISMCDDCRASLAAFESLGGAVLDQAEHTPAVAMSDGALQSVMARLSDDMPTTAPSPANHDIPAPLVDYIGGGLDAVKWRNMGMGVRQSVLKTGRTATARLLYIPAGCAVPDHGHQGTELTLVLQGAFHDEHDHFAKGDIEIADQHVEHKPIADIGQDCICLAVTDAPLRFNALIPRLAQPFLGI